jgi:hypothetical protein
MVAQPKILLLNPPWGQLIFGALVMYSRYCAVLYIRNAKILGLKSGLFCKSANPYDFWIYPQIANLQISTKCGTTLPQNSPKVVLKTIFFVLHKFELEL